MIMTAITGIMITTEEEINLEVEAAEAVVDEEAVAAGATRV